MIDGATDMGSVTTGAGIVGAIGGAVYTGVETARNALLLVAKPAELVTTTVYVAASALVTDLKTRFELVAPATFAPFFFH